jgi:hypothetical protein
LLPLYAMPVVLTAHQVRRLRLRAQGLHRPEAGSAEEGAAQVELVTRALCGVQAQYEAAAALTLRARTAGLLAADVEHARVSARSVVRTWCQRFTLHLLAADDLPWLLPLVGAVSTGESARRAQLGLDHATLERGLRAGRALLGAHAPLTRPQLAERLATHGLRLEGQALPHLVGYAALHGVVCCGPDRGARPTYVLLEDWLPGWPSRIAPQPWETALQELARRYLAAYGPAGPEDLASWSGLPLREARAAWRQVAPELVEVEAAGRAAWLSPRHRPWLAELGDESDDQGGHPPVVRLVAGYDTYLLGYRSRDFAVPPEHARRVHPGGGLLHPTLLADGRAVGTWRTVARQDSLDVVVTPFDAIPGAVGQALEAEVSDVGRFLGAATTRCVLAPT